MHFIYAPSDLQFDAEDIQELKKRLAARIRSEYVIRADFSALSYQDGLPQDVIEFVNMPILRILSRYH